VIIRVASERDLCFRLKKAGRYARQFKWFNDSLAGWYDDKELVGVGSYAHRNPRQPFIEDRYLLTVNSFLFGRRRFSFVGEGNGWVRHTQ